MPLDVPLDVSLDVPLDVPVDVPVNVPLDVPVEHIFLNNVCMYLPVRIICICITMFLGLLALHLAPDMSSDHLGSLDKEI